MAVDCKPGEAHNQVCPLMQVMLTYGYYYALALIFPQALGNPPQFDFPGLPSFFVAFTSLFLKGRENLVPWGHV